jgi:hypothetical protein
MKKQTYSGYAIRFGEVDKKGNLFLKESVDKQMFEDLKIRGEIKDFAIDDNGVMIIKEIQIKSADYEKMQNLWPRN